MRVAAAEVGQRAPGSRQTGSAHLLHLFLITNASAGRERFQVCTSAIVTARTATGTGHGCHFQTYGRPRRGGVDDGSPKPE